MNNTIIAGIVGVIAGGVAGALGMRYYLTKNFDEENEAIRKLHDEELDALKKQHEKEIAILYKEAYGSEPPEDFMNKPVEEETEKTDISEESGKEVLQKEVEKLNYGDFSKKKETKKSAKKGKKPVKSDIYTIEPEDFSGDRDFEKVTLTYLEESGEFLTVEDDIFEGGLDVIGEENLEHFGEYEDGVLYVRNEANRTDYEVIHDDRSYEDYMSEEHPID